MPTMASASRHTAPPPRPYGPEDNGTILTPRAFDRAEFEEGWRYELINGVLVVSPIPFEREGELNEELGYWLRHYQHGHPEGICLLSTLVERVIVLGDNRRRPDRVIWIGPPSILRQKRLPTIVAEFVSKRKRDRLRDYETKRDEYLAAGIKEYWVIDRFAKKVAIFTKPGRRIRATVLEADQDLTSSLLPGFALPLKRLFAVAERWAEEE